MDAHYDRVSQNSFELCIMHLHYALGVHIVCYVLRITYYVYVLCIMYYALPLGVNIVCYVLCITYYAYYALRTGSPHRLLCITYYVLRIMHYALGVHIRRAFGA